MGAPRVPAAERLTKNSRVDPLTGCRIWIAGLDWKGYAQIKVHGRTRRAHRVAWEEGKGPIPKGMCVLHDCPGGDNRACVNVEHLWLGTVAQNNADKVKKGTQSHKGPQGEAHPRAKLRDEQVYAIRSDFRRQKTIAKAYGISKDQVGSIRRRESWAHLP